MNRLIVGAILAGLAIGVAGIAAVDVAAKDKDGAKGKKGATAEAVFKRMDKDSSGDLSADEFKGKREGEKAEKAAKRFKKLDTDGNGSLSLEEFKVGFEERAPKKKKD